MTTVYHNNDEMMDVECDECGNNETYFGTFQECINQMKREGWIIWRDEKYGDWSHYCSRNCRLNSMF